MYTGWYFFTISQNSGVMRSGRCEVMRLPMRMISTGGMARSRWERDSRRRAGGGGGEPWEEVLEPAVGEPHRIAARHDHVADLRMRRDVLERRLVLVERNL